MITPYRPATEQLMQQFYATLSEKDKRRYAAIEAHKLGHGGISYIAHVLGCARNTVAAGLTELGDLPATGTEPARVRQPGGGRKPYTQTHPTIDAAFLAVVSDQMAGDPMDASIRWTHLTLAQLQARLAEAHGIEVSAFVIKQLLHKHHFRRRKAQKK